MFCRDDEHRKINKFLHKNIALLLILVDQVQSFAYSMQESEHSNLPINTTIEHLLIIVLNKLTRHPSKVRIIYHDIDDVYTHFNNEQ